MEVAFLGADDAHGVFAIFNPADLVFVELEEHLSDFFGRDVGAIAEAGVETVSAQDGIGQRVSWRL